MRANVEGDPDLLSERVLSVYAGRVGKHRAQAELQILLAEAHAEGRSLAEVVVAAGVVDAASLDALAAAGVPAAEHAVDTVTVRLSQLLDTTPEVWS